MLDKQTRDSLGGFIRKTIVEVNEVYQEEWITGKELCKAIQFFSPDWLKRFGETLPREKVKVTDADGIHCTSWCYPKRKILRMISDGELRHLIH